MSHDTWQFYKDNKRNWWWRRISPNGRVVGGSTEGYVSKSDCIANAKRNGYVVIK